VNYPSPPVKNRPSPRLRNKLMEQRREMFAETEGDYLGWECEALQLVPQPDVPSLAKAVIRSTWIAWAGEPPANWREQMPTMIEVGLATLAKGIANERGRTPWANDQLLQRTIVVIQRRSLFHISPGKAAKALCRIESLVHQGVRQ
jgi:hypothetical protein